MGPGGGALAAWAKSAERGRGERRGWDGTRTGQASARCTPDPIALHAHGSGIGGGHVPHPDPDVGASRGWPIARRATTANASAPWPCA